MKPLSVLFSVFIFLSCTSITEDTRYGTYSTHFSEDGKEAYHLAFELLTETTEGSGPMSFPDTEYKALKYTLIKENLESSQFTCVSKLKKKINTEKLSSEYNLKKIDIVDGAIIAVQLYSIDDKPFLDIIRIINEREENFVLSFPNLGSKVFKLQTYDKSPITSIRRFAQNVYILDLGGFRSSIGSEGVEFGHAVNSTVFFKIDLNIGEISKIEFGKDAEEIVVEYFYDEEPKIITYKDSLLQIKSIKTKSVLRTKKVDLQYDIQWTNFQYDFKSDLFAYNDWFSLWDEDWKLIDTNERAQKLFSLKEEVVFNKLEVKKCF